MSAVISNREKKIAFFMDEKDPEFKTTIKKTADEIFESAQRQMDIEFGKGFSKRRQAVHTR